ncbi:ATP-binding protein [Nocardioides donggukensis]|uniref:Anti-sigma factor n=1 Tax=Nocardioides donggukensis TaxID=2774019 RepID=A0A927K466_9ACTN|nr:anti-sigma factor [Nocardioides donggukensis]MBD8870129.1 anti-sigma factor [Nocardioides donggukensis]
MRPDVELRLPADSAYVAVLRATTVSLAARLDFTIDDIEDLRIAVGEACAMVLPSAEPDSGLTNRFYLRPGELTVTVTVVSDAPDLPDENGFAWQVLSALATSTGVSAEGGEFTVSLTTTSSVDA